MSMISPVLDALAGQLLGSGLRILHAAVKAVAGQIEAEIEHLTGASVLPAVATPSESSK